MISGTVTEIIICVQKTVQLKFMLPGKKRGQACRQPFIIIIQTRNKVTTGHSYSLISDCTSARVKFIANIGNAWVIQLGDIRQELVS